MSMLSHLAGNAGSIENYIGIPGTKANLNTVDFTSRFIKREFAPKNPTAPPGPPNPNDVANEAQSLTDQMRMRRGLMANLYAGTQQGQGSQPIVGKTALGN